MKNDLKVMLHTSSPEETGALGEALGACLKPGDLVPLTGDLGAGKSVLARGLARGAGVKGAMPSPTFTLMQPYKGIIPFYHFDLYRLQDEDEFLAAGLDEYIGGDGAAVVEWPDRADPDAENRITIAIDRSGPDDDARDIVMTMRLPDKRVEEILKAVSPWRVT